jgi:hypothetical protein
MATLYNVWDQHFDDLMKAECDSPLLEAPSAEMFDEAKDVVGELLNELYQED